MELEVRKGTEVKGMEKMYGSFKLLGSWWILKFCLVFVKMIMYRDRVIMDTTGFEVFEYVESALYIGLMLLTAYEDYVTGTNQLPWAIILTVLMGMIMEYLAMAGIVAVMAIVFMVFVGSAGIVTVGSAGMVVFGLMASWAGVLGNILLILFLVGSVVSSALLFG